MAAGVQPHELRTYDLAVVGDGDCAACIARALQLLKPRGGVLVVADAARPALATAIQAHVPSSFPRYDAATAQGFTSVFLTCPPGSAC